MNEPNRLASIVHDAPVEASAGDAFWGSDSIAAVVREFDIPFRSRSWAMVTF
jgi:hypothetical protein